MITGIPEGLSGGLTRGVAAGSALSYGREDIESSTAPIDVRDSGRSCLASDSRISMRAARHAPESPLPRGRMRDPGLSDEVRMLMEFGGTVA
jgi:hypothetical protein